jgi:hypothetical protein
MNHVALLTLAPSHAKCRHFEGTCSSMRWDPCSGHVPRGFCGALGAASEVRLVLVTAEPGDPLPGETHEGTVQGAMTVSFETLRQRATPFHANVRLIIDMCFPNMTLEQQMRYVWRTNSVLCSAAVESGPVPIAVVDTCVRSYLLPQLSLFPNALVAALGHKAQSRLARHGINACPAQHPSSRVSNKKKHASWRKLAAEVRRRAVHIDRDGGGA